MLKPKLLNENQKKKLFINYHQYLRHCKIERLSPKLKIFCDSLREIDNEFIIYNDKQISNKIIDYRKISSEKLWPTLTNFDSYIPLSDGDLEKLYSGNLTVLDNQNNSVDTLNSIIESIHKNIKGDDSLKGIIHNYLMKINDIKKCADIFIPQAKSLETKNSAQLKKHIKDVFDEKEEIVVNKDSSMDVVIEEFYEIFKYFEQLKYHLKVNLTPILIQSMFLNLFSIFDAYIKDLLVYIFKKKPDLLKSITKQISISDFIEFESKEEMINNFIDIELESLCRESYIKQFEILEEKFGLKLKGFENWCNFVEITQRRNLIQHCDGKISQQYIKVCKDQKCDVSTCNLNEKLIIDFEYFSHSVNIFQEVIFLLGQTLWRKIFSNEVSDADDYLIDLSFDKLITEDWGFARTITNYGITLPPKYLSSDSVNKILLINHALALKFNNEFEQAKKIIKNLDLSSCALEFKMAKEVILNNHDKAFEYLYKIGKESEFINEKAYLSWPLFRELRKDSRFNKLYSDLYGRSFIDQMNLNINSIYRY